MRGFVLTQGLSQEIVDLATRDPDRTVKADDDEGLSLSRAFALCDQDAVFARLYPNPFLYAIKNRIVVLSGVLAVVRQQKEVPAARLFVDDALAELQQFLVRDGKSSECSRFFFEPLAGVHAFHLSVILTEQGSSPTQALSFVRTLIDMFHVSESVPLFVSLWSDSMTGGNPRVSRPRHFRLTSAWGYFLWYYFPWNR